MRLLLLYAILILFSIESYPSEITSLRDFKGVYRGFIFAADGSKAPGEAEVLLTESKISIRVAISNLEFSHEEQELSEFQKMSTQELAKIDGRDPFGFVGRTIRFRRDAFELHFLQNPKTKIIFPIRSEYGLVVRTAAGSILALSPTQQKKVSCERFLKSYEFWQGYRILRLAR
jgi:hypothetical protein